MLGKFVRVPKLIKGMQTTGTLPWKEGCLGRVTDYWKQRDELIKVRVSQGENDHLICLVDQVTSIPEDQQEAALAIWDLQGNRT